MESEILLPNESSANVSHLLKDLGKARNVDHDEVQPERKRIKNPHRTEGIRLGSVVISSCIGLDPQLLADHLIRRSTQFEKHLSSLELEKTTIPGMKISFPM